MANIPDQVDAFTRVATELRTTPLPARRRSLRRLIIIRSGELCDARDSLFNSATQTGSLISQWDWLNAHKNDPRHDEFENQWFRNEADYRLIVDALNDAKDVWSAMNEAVAV